ncbi:MAG: hypothetical protein CMK09_19225 [Ponticaulis sp.]|nr:hypothetical protein [Ponticaulis sp.]
MFSRFLSSLSIQNKLILASAPPILALTIFAGLFGWGEFQHSRQMSKTVQVTQFTTDLSDLVHELQKERGRTAGFVSSKGGDVQTEGLTEQKQATNAALANFISAAERAENLFHTEEQKAHLQTVNRLLDGLERHRNQVGTLQLGVPQSVGAYTEIVNALIRLVQDELSLIATTEMSTEMTGLISLMRAKEAAGLERAQGNAAFSSSEMPAARHQAIMSLASQQVGMFDEFRNTMPVEWTSRLETLLAGQSSSQVDTARERLIQAGYGGELNGYTSSEWFDLTTRRINELKALEDALLASIGQRAMAVKASTDLRVALIGVMVLLVVLPAIVFAYFLINNIVGPMKEITDNLDRLAKGDLDVKVSGTDRGDEIGVLASAAQQFMMMSAQREQLVEENRRNEQEALHERRKVLSQMANEVETATGESVRDIVTVADSLVETASRIQSTLSDAMSNADNANAATSSSLEDTQRASDLAAELNAAIQEVAESIVRGDQLARDAVVMATDSKSCVEDLNEATQQIGDFVRVITELADQTNLLALNATIESARAGEHGKGFAVVASEIKQLASQTNKSATQITERVKQIQERTGTAVDAINRISESIETLGGVTSSVAAAVEEQRASTDSFANFLNSNRAAIEVVASKVAALADTTRETSAGASEIAGRVQDMASASRTANESIPKIVQKAVDAADSRKAPRSPTDQEIVVKGSGKPLQTRMTDLSQTGARVVGATGGEFEVELPGNLGQVKARTAWSSDKESGVEFEKPLSSNIMAQLLAMHKNSDAA